MQKILFLFLLIPILGFAQNSKNAPKMSRNEAEIRHILAAQTDAWNAANIKGFMNGYWQSDSLTFIGKSGMNKGWQTTLDNYKKSYPTPEKMGKLTFTILKIEFLGTKNAYVIGKWHLARNFSNKTNENDKSGDEKAKNDDLNGHFTLLWQKINGKWVIISDHSS